MDRRPVLIVEDDPAIREVLLEALEGEQIPAVAVANGMDALTAVSIRIPSVMLLDLNMPELDGEGVLRELKERHVDVPVLLMTADPRGTEFWTEEGVSGHVPKPFDLDDVMLAIDMVTGPSDHDLDAPQGPQPSPP